MKKRKKLSRILAGILCLQMLQVSNVEVYTVEARETGDSIAITQLSGTTVTEKSYDESFLSVTGYAQEGVGDRTIYYEEYLEYNRLMKEKWIAAGNQPEDYKMCNTDNYYVAANEEEFCKAVASRATVIEITEDLNLGYQYVESQGMDDWGVLGANISSNGYLPISSPDIMEDGMSKIDFNGINGLTIYSKNGSTIYHCELNFFGCSDIVIRNIGIQGLNEWDDTEQGKISSNGAGGHKRYDWDCIALNECKNVWIDHCTFGIAYDGTIDISGGSTASVTWCILGKPDENTLEEMHRTMDYLEELYQNGKAHQFYTALRDGGASKEQIYQYSLLNDKVHAFSENDAEYDKNIYDKITLAYNYYENSVQRVPQIRSGNAHMFNCWVNSDAYRAIHRELSDASIGKQTDSNGNTISPIKYASSKGCSTLGLCRANSALGGATIGTDTCIFEGVINPIIGSEVQESGLYDTGIQSGAVNHNLIVNSSTRDYGKTEYIGSSWDNNGENAFVSGDYWNGNKISINDFKWAKWKDMTQDESKASDTVEYVPNKDTWAYREFYNKYYIGSDSLEYEYQIVPLGEVKETLQTYGGAGKVIMDEEDWLTPDYNNDTDNYKVTYNYDIDGVLNPTVVAEAGDKIEFPKEMSKEGYTFDGWYTREFYLGEEDEYGDIPLLYTEKPVTEGTVITDDMYLYAKWKINKYKILLELNGGSTTGNSYYEVNYNSIFMINTIQNGQFTKEGYRLEGWYTDAELLRKATYLSVKNSDVTIYAKWVEEPVNSEAPKESQAPEASQVPGILPSEKPETSFSPQVSKKPEVSSQPSMEPIVSGKPQNVMGDVTGDNTVGLEDAQLVLKAALKIHPLGEDVSKLADVNGDGSVDLKDAELILKHALKIISTFH